MATIKEIALLADVSPATVSRVINGTAKVDEEKRKRVEKAIKKTGFQPNALARALYKKSSKIIGLIVPDIVNPFFNELAQAIEDHAHKNGFNILLSNSNNDSTKEAEHISLLQSMHADGIILVTNNSRTGNIIRNCKIPVIVVDRHVEDAGEVAHIESDHYHGGRLASQCLVDKGCKKIVCMRGPQSFASGKLRFKGYKDVCKENNLEVMYIDTAYSFEAGERAAKKLLEKYPDVDGVVAANDMVAMSLYKLLKSQGKKVPKDIQIVGFDDIGIISLVTPAFTTVHQPIKAMGQRAIEIVCKHINGESYETENIFQVKLIERETTRKNAKSPTL